MKGRATPEKVIQDMERLTATQLDNVLAKAAVLRLQKRKLVLPSRESHLLRVINRGLSPDKNARLNALQQKLRAETINEREHAELLRMTNELERLGAERLKALIELAALRRTTVRKLMQTMGLTVSG